MNNDSQHNIPALQWRANKQISTFLQMGFNALKKWFKLYVLTFNSLMAFEDVKTSIRSCVNV
jgi:hypothetical protein